MKLSIKSVSMMFSLVFFSCFAITAMESRMREAVASEEEPIEGTEFERAFLGLTPAERTQVVKIFEEQKAAQRRAEFNRPQKEKGGSNGQDRTKSGKPRR